MEKREGKAEIKAEEKNYIYNGRTTYWKNIFK